ncbi:outer membrane beta-barrel protein [Hymenobacter sp. 5317J-9]|uniref:outer membrane beta-barrel protein n=1 Tax=Hymenobacter sp. 5317J-9 TaxID=2932250 RepID=UPI001FD67C6F|nr:outer membrane beta-barrel protein [Hymenobacter sp. 5317J-9]UOQ99074.1 outer membrane beta-barrel protein [Hymenobacter sp. 5317J-9]
MRHFTLFISLLLGLGAARAQAPTTVSGRVTDGKDQSPLIGANVLLIRLPDSVKTGTAADAEGKFQFDNVVPGRYILDASFVGFAKLSQPVTVASQPVALGTLALQTGGVQLKGVVVTGAAAQSVQKGDTTQYNARAFKTNPDATTGDLLEKMPGVARGADGKIQAQGENVQQVLVDGKPFFGNDPDAVLKNLPAEMVDKVEVFDQRSEQSRFSGFDDGNTTKTINIVTKVEFRNGTFGRVLAGAGPDHYKASGNVNNFKGDRRVAVLAQSNNVNEQNFGTEDLLGVVGNSNTGGGGRGGRGGGGGNGGNAGDFLVNQSGGITTTNAAGLNYSDAWNKKTELSASYFFNRANNRNQSLTQRQYVLPEQANTTFTQNANTNSVNTNQRFNMRLEHKIDSANSVLFRPRFSYQMNDANSVVDGVTRVAGEEQSRINSLYNSNNKGLNTGGDVLFRHRFPKAGRTASLSIGGSYNQRNGGATLKTDDTGSALNNLNQTNTLQQNGGNITANLALTEALSRQDQLQGNYTINYAPNNSNKYTYNLVNGDTPELNESLSNVFDNYYFTQSGGLSFRHNTQKFQGSLGVAGQYSELYSDAQYPRPSIGRYYFVNVLPNANLNYRFTRQKNLRFNYRTNTSAPSVSQLQAVVNNSNPLQLTIGNPTLRQEYQHSVNFRYSASNPEVSSNFFALLNGSYTQNPIANRTTVAARETTVTPDGADAIRLPAGGQLTQPVNLSQEYSVRSLVSYGRPIKPIKTNVNLSANANFTQRPGLVNGGLNYARSPSFGAGLTLSSNISPNLDFTASTTSNKNYVRNTLQSRLNTSYFTQVTRVRLGWIVGPGINFQTDLVHQYYAGLSSGYNQPYALWNASLGKKLFPGQRGEIKIYAFDLLGQNRAIQRNVSEAYYEDVQTTILQRYFMLMFTYNIRSGNVVAPTEPADGPRQGRGFGRPDGAASRAGAADFRVAAGRRLASGPGSGGRIAQNSGSLQLPGGKGPRWPLPACVAYAKFRCLAALAERVFIGPVGGPAHYAGRPPQRARCL